MRSWSGIVLAVSSIVMIIVVVAMLIIPQGDQNATFHSAVIVSASLCLASAIWFSFPSKREKAERKRARGEE